MNIDNILDEKGDLINHWRIDSPHTPWWLSEVSEDPDNKNVKWINVGYVCPLNTKIETLGRVLAYSAVNYSCLRS